MGLKDSLTKGFNRHLRSEKHLDLKEDDDKIIEAEEYKNRTDIVEVKGKAVETIKESAFEGCEELKLVKLEKVREIEKNAFKGCKNLVVVDIPEISMIGEGVFDECENLSSIFLKTEEECNNVWKILTKDLRAKVNIYVGSEMWSFLSKCTDDDGKTIRVSEIRKMTSDMFKIYKSEIEEIITEEVDEIGDNALENLINLITVKFSDIKTLGKEVFKNCSNLKIVSMSGLEKNGIGKDIFEGCDKLKNIFVDDSDICLEIYNQSSEEFQEKVNKGEISMFYGENVPWRNISLYTSDGGQTFDLPDKIKIIRPDMLIGSSIKDSMKLIKGNEVVKISDNSFKGFNNLEEVNCPKLESIGKNVFDGCENLKDIYVLNENISYDVYNSLSPELQQKVRDKSLYIHYYDDNAVKIFEVKGTFGQYNEENKTFELSQEDRIISQAMIEGCKDKVEVIIGKFVTEIRDNTFDGCSALKSVYLPKLEKVGSNLFEGCTSLSRIYAGKNEDVCKSIYYKLPDNLREKIKSDNGQLILSYYVDDDETTMQGWNYMNAYTETEGRIFSLPEEIKKVNFEMFRDYKEVVTEIHAPGVNVVGDLTFNGFKNLELVELGNIESLMPEGAFEGCNNLKEMIFKIEDEDKFIKILPRDLKERYIDKKLRINGEFHEKTIKDLLMKCTTNDGINFDLTEEFKEITADTFDLYKDKVEIIEAKYVTKIEDNAFKGYKKLSKIILDEVKEIGRNVFDGCVNLTFLVVSNEELCKNLYERLPESIKSKEDFAIGYYEDEIIKLLDK